MVKRRILLVDDDSAFTSILKLLLRGLEVCVENDPAQAIATAVRFKPDLIFMDVIMPNAHGGTIAAQFKKNPALRHIPVVFLSASISASEAESNKEIAGYDFLWKPATREQILECVERHLGGSSSALSAVDQRCLANS